MILEQVSNDVWRVRRGTAPIRWVGLLIVALAALPLAGAAGLVELKSKSGGNAPAAGLAVFGGVLLVVGLVMLLHRLSVTFDLTERTVRRRSVVLGIGPSSVRAFADFTAAAHERRVIRTNKGSHVVYPVLLEGEGGKPMPLVRSRDAVTARQTAEAIAKLLGFAVIDRTDGTDRRREHDELDLSLRQRRERFAERPVVGAPPAGMRSTVTTDGDSIVVQIPGFGVTALHIVGLLLATAPFVVFTVLASVARDAPAVVHVLFRIMGALPTIVIAGLVLRHAWRRWEVVVSAGELRVEQRAFTRKVTALPADEIEELNISDAGGRRSLDHFIGGGAPILAITDRAQVRFGSSLRAEEGNYLVAVLRGALSAPARSPRA